MFGRWFSLAAGVVTAMVIAVLLLYVQAIGPGDAAPHTVPIVVSAITTGTIVGLLHWLYFAHLETQVRYVTNYVDSLACLDSQAHGPQVMAQLGLAGLVGAVERTIGQLQNRIEKMGGQRRELEVQIRVSEVERRHSESVLNAISDAVIVTDAFDELGMANTAASRLLGVQINQAQRQPIEEVMQDAKLVKLIKDTREAGCGARGFRRHVEHQLADPDREAIFDVSLCGLDHGSDTGDSAGVVTILRDITKEKEIAEMKSDFVSNVSHELRTPLSSIRAYVEMLVDGEAADEQTCTEFYNIIHGETNRLSRLIDNILNISRIEPGVIKVQREYISLNELVKEAVDVMQPQARAKNIELQYSAPAVLVQVHADKDMIYQAVMNLIGNAIKYSSTGGTVKVNFDTDPHAKQVHLAVTDSGVGVPEEDLPHLFDKFYRVKNHKHLAKGTGLGLNLVKQIVETVHDGRSVWRARLAKAARSAFHYRRWMRVTEKGGARNEASL